MPETKIEGFRIGSRVRHLGTSKIRIVTGLRREKSGLVVLHFNQVIKKQNGQTFYWSDSKHVKLLP